MTEEYDDPGMRIAQLAANAALEALMLRVPAIAEAIKEQVMREFAGQRIPKRTAAKRDVRNQCIREQFAAGRDVDVLAIAFRLSKDQIRHILKRHGQSESD